MYNVEGNLPIGQDENLGNGPGLFWGVPRHFPGLVIDASGQDVGWTVCGTIAEIKQTLQGQGAELILSRAEPVCGRPYPRPEGQVSIGCR